MGRLELTQPDVKAASARGVLLREVWLSVTGSGRMAKMPSGEPVGKWP